MVHRSLLVLGVMVLFSSALAAPLPPPRPRNPSLTVQMSGFRNNHGQVWIALFQSADGFPDKPERAFRSTNCTIKDGRCEVTLTDLPPGPYAVSVLHDENMNGKLDTNFMGMPTEGVGTSNNPPRGMGPPKFDSARFLLNGADQTIAIHINY